MAVLSRVKTILLSLIVIVLSVFFLIWGSSYWIIPWQVNEQLAPHKLSLTDETSMSFNPFAMHLQVDDFTIVDKNSEQQLALEHAHLNLSWTDLLSKRLVIEKSQLNSLSINVLRNNEALIVAGVDLEKLENTSESAIKESSPTADEPVNVEKLLEGWQFELPKLDLNDIAVNLRDMSMHHQITLKKFTLTDLTANTDSFSAKVALALHINEGIVNLSSQAQGSLSSLALSTLSVNNEFELSKILLEEWRYLMPLADHDISDLAGQVAINFANAINYSDKQWQIIQPQFELVVNQFALKQHELALANENFVFSLTDLDINGDDSGLSSLKTNARLHNQQLLLSTLESTVASLDLMTIDTLAINVDKDLIATAAIDELALRDLLVSKTATQPPLYENEQTVISGIDWRNNHLAIETITLHPFKSNVLLNANKQLTNLVLPPSSEVNNEQVETAPEVVTELETQPVTISLKQFKLVDSADVLFSDQSVSPAFNQKITITQLMAQDIDSRQTDVQSPFGASLAFDEHASTVVDGAIAPFGEKLNMTLNVDMTELSLPPLSAYLRTVLGFDFLSGQLDNKITLNIVDDELDGETVIGLRGFELANGDDTTDVAANDGAAIGLNAALNMLKDSQGNVSLTVPLSGNIEDPSFGISNVITLVAQKAIMSQAKSYLINTFVPYANLVTVASVAGDYLLRLEMNDLVYGAGQTDITPEQQVFVDELGALLNDKPEQQVKMCPVARHGELAMNASTMEQRNAALKKLSKHRGDKLKKLLVENYGIESARLLVCAPKVDTDVNSLPRIEFSF